MQIVATKSKICWESFFIHANISYYQIKSESENEVTQLCPILCNPMGCSLPGFSIHGILQARILEWITISLLQGIFPTQESNPGLPHWRQTL